MDGHMIRMVLDNIGVALGASLLWYSVMRYHSAFVSTGGAAIIFVSLMVLLFKLSISGTALLFAWHLFAFCLVFITVNIVTRCEPNPLIILALFIAIISAGSHAIHCFLLIPQLLHS